MVTNSNQKEEHRNEQWAQSKIRDNKVDVVVDLQVDFLSKFYHLY